MTYQNLWEATKIFRGKSIALKPMLKAKRGHINYLKQL